MATRTLSRRLGLPFGLAVMLFVPAFAFAAPRDTTDPGFFVGLARQAERDAKWDKACEFYAEALSFDKNQPEVKKRFLFCLRNYHRVLRHRDSDFRTQLLSTQFKVNEAQEFYNDVLCKVQNTYYDDQRADATTLTNLFRAGLDELLMALEDKEFQAAYIGRRGVTDADVQAFIGHVRKTWGQTSFDERLQSQREAAAQHVRNIVAEGYTRLRLNGKAVFLEFACGACNALDEYSFYVTRGTLMGGITEEKSVAAVELYEGAIGYVRLNGFTDSTVQELESAYEQLRSSGMKVLILDLRYNLGGDLDVAAEVARRFLPAPATIGSIAGKASKNYRSFSTNPLDLPMYLLIDGNTASAAELLAAALKGHDRAKLIGENTYGKNQVQKMIPVTLNRESFGAIRLTWGRFYGPDKQDISKSGVAPTFRVSGGAVMTDRQLDEALDKARSTMVMAPTMSMR